MMVKELCKLEYCDRKSRTKGYCSLHYKRLWKGIPLDKPLPYKGLKVCQVRMLRKLAKGFCVNEEN